MQAMCNPLIGNILCSRKVRTERKAYTLMAMSTGLASTGAHQNSTLMYFSWWCRRNSRTTSHAIMWWSRMSSPSSTRSRSSTPMRPRAPSMNRGSRLYSGRRKQPMRARGASTRRFSPRACAMLTAGQPRPKYHFSMNTCRRVAPRTENAGVAAHRRHSSTQVQTRWRMGSRSGPTPV